MSIRVRVYDVFAEAPFQGNQAAVLLIERQWNEYQLLTAAGEFLLPETVARMQQDGVPVFQFAAAGQVINRCGHGTIAGIADLVLESLETIGQKRAGEYRVGDLSALWQAQILSENCVDVAVAWPDRPFKDGTLSPSVIAETLKVSSDDLRYDLPMCVYNSGNRNGLVPFKCYRALERVDPDYEKLKQLCDEQKLTDLHLYCFQEPMGSPSVFTLRCRNVFPFGVREECATGTASVSLATALMDTCSDADERYTEVVFNFQQGVGQRRGKLKVVWSSRDPGGPTIWLEGRAYLIVSGSLLFTPSISNT